METIAQLQRQFVDYLSSLYHEGFVDEQFKELRNLQDESNPEFVEELVFLFFNDSEKLLNNLATTLQQNVVDYKKVDDYIHQFKGSSSSVGAQRVKNACIAFRSYYDEKNLEGCLRCLQQVKNEYYLVKSKLENLFKLEQQILAAGGSIPSIG